MLNIYLFSSQTNLMCIRTFSKCKYVCREHMSSIIRRFPPLHTVATLAQQRGVKSGGRDDVTPHCSPLSDNKK